MSNNPFNNTNFRKGSTTKHFGLASIAEFLQSDAKVRRAFPGGIHMYDGYIAQGPDSKKQIYVTSSEAARGFEIGVLVVVGCREVYKRLACSRATTALFHVAPVVNADGQISGVELGSGTQEALWMFSPDSDLIQLDKKDFLELAIIPHVMTKGEMDDPLEDGRPDSREYRKYRAVKRSLLAKLGINV